jgi:hypothetical protein
MDTGDLELVGWVQSIWAATAGHRHDSVLPRGRRKVVKLVVRALLDCAEDWSNDGNSWCCYSCGIQRRWSSRPLVTSSTDRLSSSGAGCISGSCVGCLTSAGTGTSSSPTYSPMLFVSESLPPAIGGIRKDQKEDVRPRGDDNRVF